MTKPVNKTATWLFNPFHYIAGLPALATGLGFALISALAAPWLDVRFDGLMRINFGESSFLPELAKLTLYPLLLIALLWLAAKLLTRSDFRLIDLVGTQYFARWPFLVLQGVFLIPQYRRLIGTIMVSTPQQAASNFSSTDLLLMLGTGVVMLGGTIWALVLMYRSFQVSCNVKGGKAVAAFIVAFLLALVLQLFLPVIR